ELAEVLADLESVDFADHQISLSYMSLCVPDGGTSASPPLCNQLTHRRHELDRHVHSSVRRRLVGGFIFRYRFFIGLRFVMLQNAAHALFVPAGGIFRLPHCRLLRRRRPGRSSMGRRSTSSTSDSATPWR